MSALRWTWQRLPEFVAFLLGLGCIASALDDGGGLAAAVGGAALIFGAIALRAIRVFRPRPY